MADHHYDLLVIGAGASGASVAYEAVRRGLSVALLEAGDISGGTSCRSTKLLHGGVRYLELAFKTPRQPYIRSIAHRMGFPIFIITASKSSRCNFYYVSKSAKK